MESFGEGSEDYYPEASDVQPGPSARNFCPSRRDEVCIIQILNQ